MHRFKAPIIVFVSFLLGVNVSVWWLKPTEQQLIDEFHRIAYGNSEGWPRNRWLGVPAFQNPNDVWIHQEIIAEQKPDLIVECGTASGGSALIWALIQREVNPNGRVVTIDIVDEAAQAREQPIWKERITPLLGSSTDPKIFEQVKAMAAGKNVLVILDSNHERSHVLQELKLYSELIRPGGYLIVQDSNVNGHPVWKEFGPGPFEAIEEFLASGKTGFQVDKDRERLLFTQHPNGYLRRAQ